MEKTDADDAAGSCALREKNLLQPMEKPEQLVYNIKVKNIGRKNRGVSKVVLDGVFNHTGRDFFAFKDLKEEDDLTVEVVNPVTVADIGKEIQLVEKINVKNSSGNVDYKFIIENNGKSYVVEEGYRP